MLIRHGFPFRAFRCTVSYTFAEWWGEYYGRPFDATRSTITDGFRSPFPPDLRERVVNEAIIPIHPIWTALALDTLAFGLMYGCLFWFWRWVRATVDGWSFARALWFTFVTIALGALSTVASAWISALANPVDWISGRDGYWDMARALDGDIYSEWSVGVFRQPSATGIESRWWKDYHTGDRKPMVRPESLLPRWATFALPVDDPALSERMRFVEGRGWPLVAMWSAYEAKIRKQPTPFWLEGISTLHSGIELKPHDTSKTYGKDVYPYNARIIPLGVDPIGFSLDLLIHATAWFSLFVLAISPWTVRRIRRLRGGTCAKCGYDLRGDLARGCPECGWRREVLAGDARIGAPAGRKPFAP